MFSRYLLLVLVSLITGGFLHGADPTGQKLLTEIARHRAVRQYDSALIAYQHLERHLEKRKEYCSLIQTQIEFAELYRSLNRRELGLSIIQKAEAFSENHPECQEHLARLYNRHAAILAEFNAYDVEIHNKSWKAIALASKSGDFRTVGQSYNELGRYQIYPDSAVYYYKKAYDIYSQIHDTASIGEATVNLLRVYTNTGQHDKTITLGNKTLNEYRKKLNQLIVADIYHFLSLSYRDKKDWQHAYYTAVNYETEMTLYRNKLYSGALAEVQTKYDVSLKEEEINKQQDKLDLQRQQLWFYLVAVAFAFLLALAAFFYYRQQKAKNKELNRLLDENSLLTKELNHRVKNNFQLIVNIINRELRDENADVLSRLSAVGKKIEAMSALHKQLYNQSDKLKVNLRTYVRDIAENFDPIFESMQVQFVIKIADISTGEKTAVYLGLLVTELITNSLKHAFTNTKAPLIELEINDDGNQISITYSDNGKGLEANVPPTMIAILCQQVKASCRLDGSGGFIAKIFIPC